MCEAVEYEGTLSAPHTYAEASVLSSLNLWMLPTAADVAGGDDIDLTPLCRPAEVNVDEEEGGARVVPAEDILVPVTEAADDDALPEEESRRRAVILSGAAAETADIATRRPLTPK